MADKLTEGSVVPFIMHLVRAKRISKKERDELRQLLDEASSAAQASARNNFSFLLVEFRIEHRVNNSGALQHARRDHVDRD